MNRWNDKPIQFILFWGIVSVSINFVCWPVILGLEQLLGVEFDKSGAKPHSMSISFLLFCVIVPPIETYFFQKLFYDYFVKHKKSKVLLIVLSSVVFGFFHFYSISYVIIAALNGVLLIYTYIIWQEHKISKYLIVTVIHAFHNLFFLLLEIISS
jgi:membrane protease YdiL (CAAX protease family)